MWTAPADYHNTTGEFDPAVHGFNGTNAVSLPGYIFPLDQRVIQATREIQDEFPFVRDMNSGNQLGIGEFILPLKDCMYVDRVHRLDTIDNQGRREEQLGHGLSGSSICSKTEPMRLIEYPCHSCSSFRFSFL